MDFLFDPGTLTVATTISFLVSPLPIIALVVFWPKAKPVFWIVAAGFFTSLIPGDSLQRIDVTLELSEGRWLNTYVWPPVQFAVFARAVVESTLMWWAVAAVLAAIATVQLSGPIAGPELIATIVGMVVVVGFTFAGDDGPLDVPILVYCGLGSVLWLLYAANYESYRVSTSWWYAYQVARVSAIALFIRAAHREARRA